MTLEIIGIWEDIYTADVMGSNHVVSSDNWPGLQMRSEEITLLLLGNTQTDMQ